MRIPTHHLIGLVLVAAAILVHGCVTDDGVVAPEQAQSRFPASPDLLMDEFARVYAAMDLQGYAELLHEDFIFSFQACDVEKLGLSEDHDTRADELEIAAHMFARKPYVKASGQVVAPILAITFVRFEQVGDWVGADDPERPGVLKGIFAVDVRFDRGEAGVLATRGQCVFFVTGDAALGYRLVGWVDGTGGC